MRRKESSEPPSAKGKLEPLGLGGNPGSCGEKKALSHGAGNTWSRLALGKLKVIGERVIPGPPGPGESQSQPVIRATGTQARLLAPEGGRAAQRTLRNRRDGVARRGEAAASHTCSGLVLLCPDGPKSRAPTR